MTVIAILATLGAIVWTVLVLYATMNSARPTKGIEGKSTIYVAWTACAVLWFAWWIA